MAAPGIDAMKHTLTLLTALLLAPLAVSPAAESKTLAAAKNPVPLAAERGEQATWAAIDDSFRVPPNAFRVVQYCGHDGTVAPVDKMRESGIGGAMLFLSSHNYLRDEAAWSNMLASIRLAKKAGLQVWVADDNGYPSGMAGGRVVEANPRFEVRVLQSVTKRGNGPVPVRIDLPPRAESFVSATLYPWKDGQPLLAAGKPVPTGGARVETIGLEGEWELHTLALRVNDEGTQAMTTKEGFLTSGRYPNLLDVGAMDAFVEMTHAEYVRRLGPLQGKIDVFYSNEPNQMTIWHSGGRRPSGEGYLPWAPDLSRRFRRDHGYDLGIWLPALFRGGSDEALLVRRHFYQTVGNLFSENYTGRIAQWAECQGVRSGGHLFIEERMDMHVISEGNFMKAIGDQQIPGCDVPMPDPGQHWNYWMPKYVGSAAQLRGRETVSVLIDPIIDRQTPTLTPKPEEMMRFINMACLMGCNQVTSYIYWDRYAPEVYRAFNEQVGRVCLMLRGAKNAATIALYYPIETFQSLYRPTDKNWGESLNDYPEVKPKLATQETLIRSLLENGHDFSWLDGEAVLAAKVDDGQLKVGDYSYTAIILPNVDLLPLAIVRKLEQFQRAGGRVLWVDGLPRLGDAREDHEAVRNAVAGQRVVPAAAARNELGATFPSSFRLRVEGVPKGLFVGRYTRHGRRMTYLVNSNATPVNPAVKSEAGADATVRVYNPVDGTIREQKLPFTLTIEGYASRFLVE